MRKHWGVAWAVAAFVAASLGSQVSAAELKACAYAADIRALAPLLLPGPQELPGKKDMVTVADAAYVLVRDGLASKEDQTTFLQSLPAQGPVSALFDALRLMIASPEDRLAAIDAPIASKKDAWPRLLTLGSPSFVRAAIRDGHGERLFSKLKELVELDGRDAPWIGGTIALAAADLDDVHKLRTATQAVEAGFQQAGLTVAASMNNLTDWLSVARDHMGRPDQAGEILRSYRNSYGFAYRQMGLEDLPSPLGILKFDTLANIVRTSTEFAQLSRNSWFLRRRYSQTYLNDIILKVEASIVADTKAGTLTAHDQDALDLEIVRRLDQAVGRKSRIEFIGGASDISAEAKAPRPVTPYREFYLGIVRLALRDFVAGSAPDLPAAAPQELPANYPWQLWTNMAKQIRQGNLGEDADHRLASELLSAAGRTKEAVNELKRWAPSNPAEANNTASRLLKDLAFRCGDSFGTGDPYMSFYRFD